MVLIVEDTAVTNRENRQLERETDNQGGFNFSGEASGGFGDQGASTDVEAGANTDRSFGGTATFRSDREIEDRMSVVVVEVLPSGNLVIRGRTDNVVGDEHRSMTITGVIRPIDIGPDNTITSDFVTDLQLQYLGEGSDSKTLGGGWFSRLSWLNPF
jgi:flagellar L-ring protein precursor FlgH